jgi:cytochrome b
LSELQDTASIKPARSDAPARVVVWDLPLRLFHWSLAASVLIAWFTPNAYDTTHRVAGYVALGLIAFRLVWGIAGTRHSRFHPYIRLLRAMPRYIWDLRRGRTGRYLGLNPAGAAMAMALILLLAISTITGWMSVTVRFFGVDWVEETHRYSSHLALVLIGVHVLGVLLMCVLQQENLVWSMMTGRKRERKTEDGRREA